LKLGGAKVLKKAKAEAKAKEITNTNSSANSNSRVIHPTQMSLVHAYRSETSPIS